MDRVERAVVHQGSQQDDGARNRDGETEDQAGVGVPAPIPGKCEPKSCCDQHLDGGAGDGDGSDPPEVVEREVKSDTEHQEYDAQFGQLGDRRLIADKAWRGRSDCHARDEVADDRRQADARSHDSTYECIGERDGDVQEQRQVMHGAALKSTTTS